MDIITLNKKSLTELRTIAKEFNLPRPTRHKKESLILQVSRAMGEAEGLEIRGGVLEIMNEGIGFLRQNYHIGSEDVYVSQAQLRRYELRSGDMVIGHVRPPRESERHYGLLKVEYVNGLTPDEARDRPRFGKLTPIFPEQRFNLEYDPKVLSTRIINLIAPIGRGQRGMIVSPPKAGKTTILKEIANAIFHNHPEVQQIMSLIGERPEEVTDMDRSVEAEVVASTFDEPVTAHVRMAEIALERSKRLVESGYDVVILMDSLTRLARAYNLVVNPSGRTLSGGLDPSALYPPKSFFGARTFPAIDIERSSTRREDLLLGPDIMRRAWLMRRMFLQMVATPPQGAGMDISVAMEAIIQQVARTKTNLEFLETLND